MDGVGGVHNMSWNDMVQKYPDRWVAVSNAVMEGADIVSGNVVAVKTDNEICEYEDKHLRDGLIFRRTTEGHWSGIIKSNLAISVN